MKRDSETRADFLKLRAGMSANRTLDFVSETPSDRLSEKNVYAETSS